MLADTHTHYSYPQFVVEQLNEHYPDNEMKINLDGTPICPIGQKILN